MAAAPDKTTTLEFGVGGLPLVYRAGLNTNQAANFGSTLNVVGAITPAGGTGNSDGSTSARTISTGNRGAVVLTQGNSTAFVTTDTYIAEVFVEGNCTINGVAVLMGTTAGNGDIAVALANSSGVIVAQSTAATITTGTSTTYTQVAFSSPYSAIGPATYYVCVQGNNTGDFIRTHQAGNFGAALQTSQTFNTFTTITPPTTFTANQGPVADLY